MNDVVRVLTFKPNNYAQLEAAKPIRLHTTWSDDYGRRGNVYVSSTGEVVVEVHTDPVDYKYKCRCFANLESYDAHRTEQEYVDREHRFPGANPHRQDWQWVG